MTIVITLNKDTCSAVDSGSFQTRSQALMKILDVAKKYICMDKMGSHTVQVTVVTSDSPIEGASPSSTAAAFVFMCGAKEKASLECAPDFAFGGWPEARIPDFDDVAKTMSREGLKPHVHSKILWIGNVQTHPSRNIIVSLAKDHPHQIDAFPMIWINGETPSPYISLPDHTKYKYLLDIEGGGYSARLKLFMWSRRLVFVQDRPWWDYVTSLLIPWVHYVPVKRDMSDLIERIEWAEAHPLEVQTIIANAYEFAQKNIHLEAAAQQFAKVLTDLYEKSLAKHAIP